MDGGGGRSDVDDFNGWDADDLRVNIFVFFYIIFNRKNALWILHKKQNILNLLVKKRLYTKREKQKYQTKF